MTRKLFGLLTIGLALSLVPGAMAQDSEPLKVGMTTWAGYGLIHLAERKGFFDKRGVDVEIVATEDKPSTAAAIATGRLHGWATTVDTFIFYDAGKLGLRPASSQPGTSRPSPI
jgi:NitT/TauT family transport system substrate-binding protein